MNKNLKKLVSSLMAFVMVLSSMVFANVSSVMAGVDSMTTVTSASSAKFGGTIQGNTSSYSTYWITNGTTLNGITNNDYMDITINAGTSGRKNSGSMFNDSTLAYSAGLKDPTIEINVKTAGTLVIDYAGGGAKRYATITYGGTGHNTGTTGANDKGIQTYFDVDANSTGVYTLTKGDSNIYVYAIGFIAGSTSSDTTYYWSLDTSSLTSLGLTGTLALSATTTSTTNKLTYSGTDYKLNKTSVTSADATSGSGTESAPYVIKADASWFTQNVGRTTVSSPVNVNLSENLTAAADSEAIAADTVVANYFTVVGSGAKKRVNSSGAVYAVELGKKETGNLEFTLSTPLKVTVSASSTGSSNSSDVAIISSDGTVVKMVTVADTSESQLVIDSLPAGTYQIVSPTANNGGVYTSRGARIFTVDFSNASEGSTETTTESTTESTTEATTKEDSTETTTAVSGGITYPSSPVPMGTYDDFTALDTNYFYLSSGCTAGNNIDIPVGEYVSFVVNTDCTMSFTIGNKAMYVVDESGNKTSYKTGAQTISLTAGKYYLESADASKYTRIKNSMVFESTTKYDVTPSFSVTEAATSITVNGQAYTAGTVLQLTAGSYPVVYVVGTTTYKGTLVVNSDGTYATVQLTEAGAIKLYNGETLIDGYDTITAAVEAASAGNTIKVPAGEYNEKLTLSKSITIESLSGNNDVTIYYNGGAQTSLGENATIKITTADGVTLKNLTVKNTYNLAEQHTAKSQAPAINVDKKSFNNVFTNCSIESVQDTLLFRNCGNSTNTRATLNNCTVIGETDFVCGTGIVNFNNCSFNIACYKYNNSGAEVASGTNTVYVFSPTPYSTFNVNNGSIGFDTKYNNVNVDFNSGASTNVYYARVWDKSSVNSTNGETIELYLNGVSTNVSVNKTNKSLNGFYCQSINGRIPTTSVWFNIYNTYTENPTNTKGSYDYSTHDANLFQYKGYAMEDGMLYLYGDFMAGTGTGFVKNSTTVDPVLNDIESIGILVGSNTKTDTNIVANTYVFTKLKNGDADVCTGNPYAAFVAIDFTDVTDYSTVGTFDVYTYTKYVSSDDYCVSGNSYSVTVTDANTASVQ